MFHITCQLPARLTGFTTLLVLFVAAAVFGGTGPGSASRPARAADTTVVLRNVAFTPATVTVAPSDTVAWRNDDFVVHTVTANDWSWDSGLVSSGGVFTRTFSSPGSYPYFCEVHPGMSGTIQVTGGQSPAPTVSPAATAPSSSPRVTVTLPQSGSVIPGDSFTAAYTATGVTIVAADGSHTDATGHYHLFLDQPVTLSADGVFARGQGIYHTASSSQVITGLATGPHTLTVALGHGDHTPFSPPVMDSVTFTSAPAATKAYLPVVFRAATAGW